MKKEMIVVHQTAGAWGTNASITKDQRKRMKIRVGAYHVLILNGFINSKLVYQPKYDGFVEIMRSFRSDGHHVKGKDHFSGRYYNEIAYGVAVVGPTIRGQLTRRQMVMLLATLRQLMVSDGIMPDEIYGHNELDPRTACPGRIPMAAIRKALGGRNVMSRADQNERTTRWFPV